MTPPVVSVLVSFWNAEKFLEECVESVLGQTHSDWELLLVDDGSTDGSTAIARRYSAGSKHRVRYLEHPGHANRGQCAGRNLGIRSATGRYLAILDADDVWLPSKLQDQVEILEKHPYAAMVFGRSRYWYSWNRNGCGAGKDYIPELGVTPNRILNPPEPIRLFYPLGKAYAPCPSDLLLRRDAVEAINGFDEEDFRGNHLLYEDQAFLFKLYLKFPIYVTDACWTQYRVHTDSFSSKLRASGRRDEARRFFFRWAERYTRENCAAPIQNLVNQALFPYRHPWLARLRDAVIAAR